MLELISTGISTNSILGLIGILASIVTIIVEMLKKIVPQNFPTKALVMIVSFIITLGFVLIFGVISIKSIALSIVGSFVVGFISMYGWDTFSEIIERFKKPLQ